MRMTALSGKLRFSLNGRGYPLLYALLFGAAAVASLFFNGMRIEYFALSLFILFMLLYVILWRGYSRGLQIPKTPLAIALTLFWLWLAVTQLWSRVPYVSMVNFWWVGSACLVFWLMSLDPDRERVWPWTSAVVLAIGLALAAVSLSQLVAFDLDPRGTFLTRNTQAAFLGLVAVPATRYFRRRAAGRCCRGRRCGLGASSCSCSFLPSRLPAAAAWRSACWLGLQWSWPSPVGTFPRRG